MTYITDFFKKGNRNSTSYTVAIEVSEGVESELDSRFKQVRNNTDAPK